MNALCWLFFVAVAACDPAAQAYDRAAQSVPIEHWRLTHTITIHHGPDQGWAMAASDGTLILPRRTNPRAMRHEIGHLVGYSRPELEQLWALLFWENGRPRGRVPSDYARTDPAEDFAESYLAFIDGELARCCRERARWLRLNLPELIGFEGRGR